MSLDLVNRNLIHGLRNDFENFKSFSLTSGRNNPTTAKFPIEVPDASTPKKVLTPVFDFIPASNLLWRDGAIRDIGTDLTNHGDGSYTLGTIPAGLSAGATVYIEWEHTEGVAVSGNMYSQGPAGTLVGGFEFNALLSSGLQIANIWVTNRSAGASQSGRGRYGMKRFIAAIPQIGSDLAKFKLDDRDIESGTASTTYTTPTRITVGRRIDNASILSGVTVKRVVIFAGYLTDANIESVMSALDPDPITIPSFIPKWVSAIKSDTGATIIPIFQVNWARNLCWLEGRERTLTDVMELRGTAPNQQWVLKKAPRGLRYTTGYTVITDVAPNEMYHVGGATDVSGQIFQSFGATNSNPTTSTAVTQWNWAMFGGFPVFNYACNNPSSINGNMATAIVAAGLTAPGSAYFNGIHRIGMTVPTTGGTVRDSLDAYPWGNKGTSTLSSVSKVPDYFGFGAFYNGSVYSSPVANATNIGATIYAQSLTESEMRKAMTYNEYNCRPIWTHGDSFDGGGHFRDSILMHLRRMGYGYVPIMRTGEGGKGLTRHELYIQSMLNQYPLLSDSTMIINEGGFDIANQNDLSGVAQPDLTTLTAVQKVYAIAKKFNNRPFVFMEPHTNLAAATVGAVATLQTFFNAIKETFPTAWAPTNRRLQSQYTDSAAYTTAVSAGTTPVALREDDIHLNSGTVFSESTSGVYNWSLSAIEQLQSIGALPNITIS